MENKKIEELEEVQWGGLLNEFLWTCAGVNKKFSVNVLQIMLNMPESVELYCLQR